MQSRTSGHATGQVNEKRLRWPGGNRVVQAASEATVRTATALTAFMLFMRDLTRDSVGGSAVVSTPSDLYATVNRLWMLPEEI